MHYQIVLFLLTSLFIGCVPPHGGPYKDTTGARVYSGGETEVKGYSQHLEKKPQDAMALYLRGCSYYNILKFDAAIADFDKVLELNKKYLSSSTKTNKTPSATNPPSGAEYREFLRMSSISQVAGRAVGSRTGMVGSLGGVGAFGYGSAEPS